MGDAAAGGERPGREGPARLHRHRLGRFGRLRETATFYLVAASFGVMCLAWSLPAAVLHWMIPPRSRPRIGQHAIMTGFRIYLWIMRVTGMASFDLHALDALAGEGPMVIVCNHRCLLDAVLVISRLPLVVCITKASLWDNTFLGGGIRMAAYIRNDAPLKLIRGAAAALRHGQQLLIFPEGTRAASAELSPFKAGFVLMAKAADVPVQTVILESNSPYLQKGWGFFRKPELPLFYRARLGRRFDVTGERGPCAAEIEQYFRHELAAGPGLPRLMA
jgi:1-acyl-sn-glycerol-3-phosphate acyltransferase